MFDRMKKFFVGLYMALAVMVNAVMAHAEGPLFTVPTVSVTELGAMITSILAALALVV